MPARITGRVSVLTVAALLSTVAFQATNAHAATGINAFTEDSVTQIQAPDVHVDTSEGDTIVATTSSTTGALTLAATKSGTTYTTVLRPPTGQPIAVGTYSVSNGNGASGSGFSISPVPVGITGCGTTGTVNVTDVAFSGSNVSSLAASYALTCSTGIGSVSGELRLSSTSGYKQLTVTPAGAVGFGQSAINAVKTVTVTMQSVGTQTATLGAPAITGNAAAAYSLSNDTCSGAALSASSTCTVDVHFTPTTLTVASAKITYPADTAGGERDIFLTGTGASPPSAPTSPRVIPGDDGVSLQWFGPTTPNGTITGYRVYRNTGSGYSLVASPTSGGFTDSSLASGATVSYQVSAVNTAGEGALSAPVSTTVLARVATPGSIAALTVDADPGVFSAGGQHVIDSAAVTATSSPFAVTLSGSDQGTPVSLSLGTVEGSTRIGAGTYDTTSAGDATHPSLQVAVGASAPCAGGQLTLTAADFHADGSPDVLSGNYSMPCGGGTTVTGEFRYHATNTYDAASVTPATVSTSAPVGQTAAATTVTIADTGTTDETLGTVAVTGTAAADFAASNNNCSGTVLAPNDSCTLKVGFTPSAPGARNATLTVADNTAHGARTVLLTGIGEVAATAPQDFTATPAAGRVYLTFNVPANNGGTAVTGYTILRGDDPGSLSAVGTATASATSYIDATATVGHTYQYAVEAITTLGPGAASASIDATPRANEIVFAQDTTGFGQYDIYAAAPDGSDPVPVVTSGGDKGSPVVSPDGRFVAYSDNAAGNYNIWVARMDGTGSPVQLTTGNFDDEDPAWSPDGTTVAFDRTPPGSNAEPSVYVVPASGGDADQVGNASEGYRPSWTPSGRDIVFAGTRGSTDGIDIVTATGTSARTTIPGTVGGVDPQLSPDGKTVVFVAPLGTFTPGDCGGNPLPRTAIETIPITGGTATPLLGTGANEWLDDPTWWPNGSAISFDLVVHCSQPGSILTRTAAGGTVTGLVDPNDALEPSVNVVPQLPRPVEGLAATLSATSVVLSWTPSGLPASLAPGSVIVRRSAAGGTAPTSPADGIAVYTGTAKSTTVTGLTSRKTYAFSVFRLNKNGVVSTAATLSATPQPAPTVRAATTSATSSAVLPFPVSWTTAGGTSTSYQVETKHGASAATTWIASTTSTTASLGQGNKPTAVRQGDQWEVTVRGRDAFGNFTAFSKPAVVAVPYDDRARQITWSKGWKSRTQATRWLGSIHTATSKGMTMTAKFIGASFTLIGDRGPTDGSFKVYLDNKLEATVSTHAGKGAVRQLLWSSSHLAKSGKHTIKVVVSGTKGHPTVGIDAVGATS